MDASSSQKAHPLGRVLVVDDETRLMTTLCEALEEQGYQAVGLTSGADALKALKEQDFDLLLADLMMPRMDGIELLQAGLEIDPQLAGIIMTGQGTVQTAVEAMKVGALDYVLKPFKMSALLPILSRSMEIRRLRLENLQLHETLSIHQLSQAVSLTLDLDTILNEVADAALGQCEADGVSIMLPTAEGDALVVATARGPSSAKMLGQRVPMDQSIAGWVARHQEPLILPGEAHDPRFPPVAPRTDIKSAISMPMLVGGKVVGILNVNAIQRRPFTSGQVKALSILTSTAAAAVEHARLYTEAREAERKYRSIAERMSAVNEFAHAVSSTLDLDSVFNLVVRQVCSLVNGERCSIAAYDGSEDVFRVAAVCSARGESNLAAGAVLDPADSASGMALRTRVPFVSQDAREAPVATSRRMAQEGILSLVSLPVVMGDTVWGTLNVGFGEPYAATPDRVEFLEAIASHLAVAIKNAQLYTELDAAHHELRQTQRQVVRHERLHALGQMASGIAHDFNNALVPVLGFSELLLEAPGALEDKDRVRRDLDLIRNGAQDAAKVVSRLREFYRQREEGELVQPVDPNRVVEEVISLTQPRWKDQALASGITIRIESDLQEVPLVAGSEADLREALMNVLLNAVDAMAASGTVTLRSRADGPWVCVEVSDTGTGMSDYVRERCLEPLFSTKGEYGSGLGLSMVYGIVRRHEGTIEIESGEGKGTTVSIRLPAQTGPRAAQPTTDASAVSRPLRVLLVDDQAVVRQVVAEYLAADGHTVEAASDGDEALEKFRAGPFDLVVTDRGMPEMGGDQLAAAIKDLSPDVPVILLTGFGDLMLAAGEQPAGVDWVVGKPVRVAALRQAVAKAAAFHA